LNDEIVNKNLGRSFNLLLEIIFLIKILIHSF